VVFDLDGTLIDSRKDITTSIRHGIAAVGGPPVPDDDVEALIGRPLSEMYAALLPAELRCRVEEAAAAYRAYYFEHCAERTVLFPGVLDCLDRLAAIPLAVATTKMTYMAVELLERIGLAPRFALIQGSDGIPHKPDPAILDLVLATLGKSPGKSWMVGDTTYDIEAAQAAGMRSCAVTCGIGGRRELEDLSPDLLLDSIIDFPGALGVDIDQEGGTR
jgi:phosphoglycolate phosphatase